MWFMLLLSLSGLVVFRSFFFFNDTATTEIYTLSLHDALPIYARCSHTAARIGAACSPMPAVNTRSEEHTSELQSRLHLVCRLLLEKKKENNLTSTNRECLCNSAGAEPDFDLSYQRPMRLCLSN